MIESDESVRGGHRGRVLLLAPQPFYEDRGTPIAVRQVLRALSELDYRTDVVTYPIGASPEIPGVEYFRVRNPFGFRDVPIGLSAAKVVFDLEMLPLADRLLEERRYDLIHAVEEAAFLAVLLTRRRDVPVLYDMQSSLPEQMAKYPLCRNAASRRLLRGCERWLLRNVDGVVSSAGLAARVREAVPGGSVHEWQFHALPPASTAPDAPGPEELRERLGVDLDASIVLYCGNFAPYQGIRLLVEAIPAVAARHSNAVFVLVGLEDSSDFELPREAKQLVERGTLHLVPRQPRGHVPLFLALADVLVSPRLHGANLPLKIFDYLQAGRPIVATDIEAHRGLLDDDCAILVEPTSGGLADGITAVLGDAHLARRMAAAAEAYTPDDEAWLKFVRQVESVYGPLRERGVPAGAGAE